MNRLSGSHAQPMQGSQPTHHSHRSQSSYNSPVPIPTGQGNGGARERNGSLLGGQKQFDMGRSPPGTSGPPGPPSKNTKHVPCKFFRQGQCQAGSACPFSHNLDPMSHQAPCKYFMKGNCKFGAKCALAHYLPNGHRVSKADLEPPHYSVSSRGYGMNTRDDAPSFPQSDPSINDAFLMPNANPNYFPDIPFLEDEYDANPDRYAPPFRNGNAYDPPIGSPPTSQFGSPPNDVQSPQRKWPSALDAPLPPSYTGSLPNYAKVGHLGQSVPDKFGLGSPPNSIRSQKVGSPVPDNNFRGLTQTTNLKTTALGASPAHNETSIGARMMHSERNALRSRMPLSASVPVHDLDDGFGLESDLPFIPSGLHDEVLTPGEKMRRLSRPEQESSSSFKDGSEGLAIPRKSSNSVGSPPAAGSPSRFRAIFEEQQREKTTNLGHVGSPLRESWMLDGNSSISNRQGLQMSGISQAMARMELNRSDSTESNGVRSNNLRAGYSRQISSPGLTSKRIDEEVDPPTFFPMDDEGNRRGIPIWTDNQNGSARKMQDDTNTTTRSIGINGSNKPIFGFHGQLT